MTSTVQVFTFNAFQENTYVIHTPQGDGMIVDPGCSNPKEEKILEDYILNNEISLRWLINTHTHLDHILGNAFVHERFGLHPRAHKLTASTFHMATQASQLWDIPYTPGPEPQYDLQPGETLSLGDIAFEIRFVPGHEPGHIALVNHDEGYVISGDVLFNRSIGRTDLPGGNFATLEKSIRQALYTLPEETVVYAGHGPTTTIGEEKQFNPFVQAAGTP